MNNSSQYYRFTGLLVDEGWMEPAYVGVDPAGIITYLSTVAPDPPAAIESVPGFALPGFQNAHSHAFQYAMAGRAEIHPIGIKDDFWTWREEMYRCALSLDPDQAQAVAAMLYAEMLCNGYTHVAEFHYLHHDPDGRPYAHVAEMGERMLAAAEQVGIGITLIPVFYQKGGFGLDPQPRQRRFISRNVDQYLKLLEATAGSVRNQNQARLGMSVHSLRAVEGQDIVETVRFGPASVPFHLHVSEQRKEVEDCVAHTGQRPMEWVFKHLEVSDRYNMVHCTHLDDAELEWLAKSGASAVLCPSTEGNLGDGFFRMKDYVGKGGRWSIGTDSHIGLNPLEEFRMIDYRQRLLTNQRNTFDGDGALYMMKESILSGRRGMGIASDRLFALGQTFSAVIADDQTPLLSSGDIASRLSVILYRGDASLWLGTIARGRWVVQAGCHHREADIRKAFAKAIKA